MSKTIVGFTTTKAICSRCTCGWFLTKSPNALDVHVDDSLPNRLCSHWPSFWKLPRILTTSRGQNKVKFSCWGYWHIQDGSHINVKHMRCVSQPLYAMDVHMDESLPLCHCSRWPSFGSYLGFWLPPEDWKNSGYLPRTKQRKILLLRLLTHSR